MTYKPNANSHIIVRGSIGKPKSAKDLARREYRASTVINAKLDPLLELILETKRPLSAPEFCQAFIEDLLEKRGVAYEVDHSGNVTVVTDEEAITCFTAHTDTVDKRTGHNLLHVKGNIVSVQGGGVLGADCGSGMYVMLKMIENNVPGRYAFFAEEESGRVGSQCYEMPKHIQHVISFDRKAKDNLITHQMGDPGCSDEFAIMFCDSFKLPYRPDPTGSFTDSYSFFGEVPECVNVSVGYYDQHSKNETQDVKFLEELVEACCVMDWASLPAVRKPEPTWDSFWGGSRRVSYQRVVDYPSVKPTTTPSYLGVSRVELDMMAWYCETYPDTAARVLAEYGIRMGDLEEARGIST